MGKQKQKTNKTKPPKKRKQKRILRKLLICMMLIVAVIPVFSGLFPQEQATQMDPKLAQAYLEAMNQMSEYAEEPEIYDTYEVVDVPSDTSIVILQDGVERTVNLIGVENVGKENEGHLEMLLSDSFVDLEFDTLQEDEYGNLLAYVYLENGQLLNEELLLNGYAKRSEETQNIRHEETLNAAQETAKEHGSGIWGASEEEK